MINIDLFQNTHKEYKSFQKLAQEIFFEITALCKIL